MARLKVKKLESALQEVDGFSDPKLELEQYTTTPHLAAMTLYTIESCFGDIDERIVADLGCGSGRLLVGAGLLGARLAVGVDIDFDALKLCRQNVNHFDLGSSTELVQMDVISDSGDVTLPDAWQRWAGCFDWVVMNPPFGTKNNRGIDMKFVRRGLELTTGSVYSLHKTSTREHVLKVARGWGASTCVLAELKFDLPASYAFHQENSRDIAVDLIQFTLPAGASGVTRTKIREERTNPGGLEGVGNQLKNMKISRNGRGAHEGKRKTEIRKYRK